MRAFTGTCLLLLFTMSGNCLFSQSRKDLKNNRVKSITEMLTVTENGKPVTYKDQYSTYDKNGYITERTEYNRDGTVKRKETATYDKNGNKLEESLVEKKKDGKDGKEGESKFMRKSYKYNANEDKIEEVEYDENGKVIKKLAMNYNTAGNKTLEVEYDTAGKIVKKILFTYNAGGLKVNRKEYVNEVLEKEKKYEYQYY